MIWNILYTPSPGTGHAIIVGREDDGLREVDTAGDRRFTSIKLLLRQVAFENGGIKCPFGTGAQAVFPTAALLGGRGERRALREVPSGVRRWKRRDGLVAVYDYAAGAAGDHALSFTEAGVGGSSSGDVKDFQSWGMGRLRLIAPSRYRGASGRGGL
jgi:hypothetical protein